MLMLFDWILSFDSYVLHYLTLESDNCESLFLHQVMFSDLFVYL